ncbi:hypothetical protein LTR05_007375 [Lithohypha guttulata]|uniref:Calcineurin-like phosphoesterase domain-containing protein n=1 Tax=Lithohypha guttulata TaxID=1690604 RepID=A0AAN7SV25_9EURO|nr:hypothetical protein LTR05_007375 [Lithohypha guttulata]
MYFLSRPASPFAPPSTIYLMLFHPVSTILIFLHNLLLTLRGAPYRAPPAQLPIPITCISDTHSKFPKVPPSGELLIHAGDLTNSGTLNSIQQTVDWLKSLQKPWPGSRDGYRYIVIIAGNHDSYMDERSRNAHDARTSKGSHGRKLDWGKIIYLQHGEVTLTFPGDRKLKIYGAPQIPKCGGKDFAFQYERGRDAWSDTIPDDVDILVTHNPPKWHLDIAQNGGLGCEHELKEVWRVKPTLHVMGHIHSGYGKEYVWWDEGTKLIEEVKRTAFAPYPQPQKAQIAALLSEMFNFKLYILGFRLLLEDVKGVLWTRFWKGTRNGSIMINAALTYQISEYLGNKAQTAVL